MKALKTVAIIFVALVVVMSLMLLYLFMSAEVTVEVTGSKTISAATVPAFNTLKDSVDEETFIGTIYNKPSHWGNAGEYAYVTYTIKVNNGCLVPIDMLEVQIVPLPEDVVQLGNMQEYSLAAKTSGELSASLLTHAGGSPAREMIVTYYVWGISFRERIIAGQ